jgi:hypothetical protein
MPNKGDHVRHVETCDNREFFIARYDDRFYWVVVLRKNDSFKIDYVSDIRPRDADVDPDVKQVYLTGVFDKETFIDMMRTSWIGKTYYATIEFEKFVYRSEYIQTVKEEYERARFRVHELIEIEHYSDAKVLAEALGMDEACFNNLVRKNAQKPSPRSVIKG